MSCGGVAETIRHWDALDAMHTDKRLIMVDHFPFPPTLNDNLIVILVSACWETFYTNTK